MDQHDTRFSLDVARELGSIDQNLRDISARLQEITGDNGRIAKIEAKVSMLESFRNKVVLVISLVSGTVLFILEVVKSNISKLF